MGILNITPDSFSDGSELALSDASTFQVNLDKTLHRAEEMVKAGALILDIGGESTRPGAAEVSEQEELDRVLPVLQVLRANFDCCLSIDTSSAEVMREACNAGAELINDIRALSSTDALAFASSSQAAVCLMHMQGQPRTMQEDIHYDNVVTEVLSFLRTRVADCVQAGIPKDRLLIDPGFGFGKTVQHNYQLLRHLKALQEIEIPILVGLSRKSMIGAVTDKPVDQRVAGSVAAAMLALQGGANIIRSHDVAATMDAIRVHCAFTNS